MQANHTRTVIQAEASPFDWRLGELWSYRDLIALLVWRDFVSVYKQTVLGPIWHLVRPLLTALVFTVVFGTIAELPTEGAPRFLFYLAGTIGWTYFSTSLDQTARTFVGHAHLLGKVYFHRLAIPLSIVVSNLVSLGIQLGIFLVVVAWYVAAGGRLNPSPWLMAFPFLILVLAGYALGLGVIVCAMTTRYRDLAYLVSFGLQLFMYVTPVIYPVSAVPERFRWIAQLNPLAPVFEALRLALLGVGSVNTGHLAMSVGTMLLLLVVGLTFFTKVERTFMDTV